MDCSNLNFGHFQKKKKLFLSFFIPSNVHSCQNKKNNKNILVINKKPEISSWWLGLFSFFFFCLRLKLFCKLKIKKKIDSLFFFFFFFPTSDPFFFGKKSVNQVIKKKKGLTYSMTTWKIRSVTYKDFLMRPLTHISLMSLSLGLRQTV